LVPHSTPDGATNSKKNGTGGETMDRRAFIRFTAGTAAAGLASDFGRIAAAQQKLALKASDVHPQGYPTVAAVESLGKKLETATNGRLSVQMFASMQLGGEKEAIEQAQIGAIQFARVSVGTLGPVIDDLNVFNLPFLFRDTGHVQKVIDGDIGTGLLEKVTGNDKTGLVALCWMDAGARSIYTIKKPVHGIADLKGLKIRVIGNPMFVDMMNALGGNGVAMGYDQVFSALQTGVVDGAENNPPSYVFDNHYTVAKYFTLTQHLIVPEVLVFSRKTWDGLNKDDQALIKKLGREAQLEERDLWTKYEAAALEKAKAAGNEIIELADKKPFQDAVKPVWDRYGPKYEAMIKRIQDVS
jgi:tripartite ATP-independent transporter DctP family solute receptor